MHFLQARYIIILNTSVSNLYNYTSGTQACSTQLDWMPSSTYTVGKVIIMMIMCTSIHVQSLGVNPSVTNCCKFTAILYGPYLS